MDHQSPDTQRTTATMDTLVADIRIIRDARIRNLMRDPDLLSFLEDHFDVIVMSPVKKEFLKRELHELSASSLDLVHYGTLLRELRETGSPVPYDHPLFNAELKQIFQDTFSVRLPIPEHASVATFTGYSHVVVRDVLTPSGIGYVAHSRVRNDLNPDP